MVILSLRLCDYQYKYCELLNSEKILWVAVNEREKVTFAFKEIGLSIIRVLFKFLGIEES